MSSEDGLLRLISVTARAGWRDVDVEMINFVFPISAYMVSSSRWGDQIAHLVTMPVW